jgi:hypothetical protein
MAYDVLFDNPGTLSSLPQILPNIRCIYFQRARGPIRFRAYHLRYASVFISFTMP